MFPLVSRNYDTDRFTTRQRDSETKFFTTKTRRTQRERSQPYIVVPAKAGTHASAVGGPDKGIPVCAGIYAGRTPTVRFITN